MADMSLRAVLRSFCVEVLKEMGSVGELRYPSFKSPVIAEN
jgi:hypothetical protein